MFVLSLLIVTYHIIIKTVRHLQYQLPITTRNTNKYQQHSPHRFSPNSEEKEHKTMKIINMQLKLYKDLCERMLQPLFVELACC